MTDQLPILLFLTPFVIGVALPIATAARRGWCQPLALGAVSLTVLLALLNLMHVLEHGPVEYALGGWAAPLGIAWLNDALAAMLVLTVSTIALIALLYGYQVTSPGLGRSMPYYTLVLMLLSGLIGIVFAADLFNLFVFLEVTALAAYALAGAAGGRSAVYAFRYLLLGSLGAALYLLGVSHLYVATGSLNMADLATRIPALITSTAVASGMIYIFLGLSIKMALLPLHGWLPDAYQNAPNTVAPLLAATVTKVSLAAWVRIEYSLILPGVEVSAVPVLVLLEELGVIAAIAGGALALVQTDLKRMFAYGGIGHVGLILVGVSLGNATGFGGGMSYLINDAFMQLCLFMIAGALLHLHKVRSLEHLRAMRTPSPWLTGALIVVAIGMVGLPPTGGFFGKWNIVLGALEAQHYLAAFSVLASTLLTLGYFIKIFACWFHTPAPDATEAPAASPSLVAALGLGSIAIVALGVFSDPIFRLLSNFTAAGGA
ncbi:MAG: proton-conducting transporter membrane subunit [Halieaceae bacterium]|nr:proton-conducting transporter membrane subunit [Halieaceae bacterium]